MSAETRPSMYASHVQVSFTSNPTLVRLSNSAYFSLARFCTILRVSTRKGLPLGAEPIGHPREARELAFTDETPALVRSLMLLLLIGS